MADKRAIVALGGWSTPASAPRGEIYVGFSFADKHFGPGPVGTAQGNRLNEPRLPARPDPTPFRAKRG